MTHKEKTALRAEVTANLAQAVLANDFNYAGVTKDGVAFTDGNTTFVLKPVIKAESYDLDRAIGEYIEAEEAKQAKAEQAKAKQAN